MMPLLRGELIKVRTTRTAFGFGASCVLLVLLFVLLGILVGDPRSVEEKRDVFNIGVQSVLLLVFGIVGATGEYRHRTLAPAALISPRRSRLTAARLLAYALTALLFGVAMVAVGLAIGVPLMGSEGGEDLAGGDYAELIAGGLLDATLCTALGVGVGLLLRNQVAAVVGALVVIFIVFPLLQIISDEIVKYTLLEVVGAVGGSESDTSLAWGTAVPVLAAYAAVFCAVGFVVESRRDIE